MKKFFFSCLAIAAIASCAKTEAVYTEGETEIQLSPVTALSTKANVNGVIDNTTYPTEEDFNVYAYWANEAAGSQFESAETYLNNVEFTNKGKFWGGAFGLIPAGAFMYMSTRYTGQVINIELPLGWIIIGFYVGCGIGIYRKQYLQKKQK